MNQLPTDEQLPDRQLRDEQLYALFVENAPSVDADRLWLRLAASALEANAERKRFIGRLLTVVAVVVLAVGLGFGVYRLASVPEGPGRLVIGDSSVSPWQPPANSAVRLDLGPANTLVSYEVWRQIADAAGMDPDMAHLGDLTLDFTPSGSLLHVMLRAIAPDGRSVSVGWEGYGGAADQNVDISGGVSLGFSPPGTPLLGLILRAIDKVGVQSLIAKFDPGDGAVSFSVRPLRDINDYRPGLEDGAPAYWWDGSEFVWLASGDSRRVYTNQSVYVAVYPEYEAGSGADEGDEAVESQTGGSEIGGGGATTTTFMSQSGSPLFFVIPMESATGGGSGGGICQTATTPKSTATTWVSKYTVSE